MLVASIETGVECVELLGPRRVTGAEVRRLAPAVARSTVLTELTMKQCEMEDAEAACLADAVALSSSLKVLDLEQNRIGDEGAARLAEAIARSASLERVFLAFNRLTDEGAIALAKATLRSPNLRFLRVYNFATSVSAERYVAAALDSKEATFTTLGLLAPSKTTTRDVGSKLSTVGRFILHHDGDHAIWFRVMEFMSGAAWRHSKACRSQ